MKKLITLVIIILLFNSPIYAGGNVETFVLSNGLKVIFKQVTDNPLVTAQLFLKSGSIMETKDSAGLASFTQNLLLLGTKKRNAEQIARDIEDIGANITSDIANDYANLGISVMDSKFEKAMQILSEAVLEPSFPDQEIEKERMNVLAAIKSRQDSISLAADDIFIKAFYGDHPYSWPNVGTIESVKKFKRNDSFKLA